MKVVVVVDADEVTFVVVTSFIVFMAKELLLFTVEDAADGVVDFKKQREELFQILSNFQKYSISCF